MWQLRRWTLATRVLALEAVVAKLKQEGARVKRWCLQASPYANEEVKRSSFR